MTELIRRMLSARRGQALAIGILAALTIAVAVGMPIFLSAADRSVTRTEADHATAEELTVHAQTGWSMSTQLQNGTDVTHGVQADNVFGKAITDQMVKAGFSPVFAATSDVTYVLDQSHLIYPRMMYRDNACDHVIADSGRCPVAAMEIMLPVGPAKALGLDVGSKISIESALVTTEGWSPGSYPASVATVVGTYHPKDSEEPYWGSSGFYDFDTTRGQTEPVLTARATFMVMPLDKEQQFIDGVVDPASISEANLDQVVANAEGLIGSARSAGVGIVVGTKIDVLAARIKADRTMMRVIVPIIALPLVGLGWFVIFLASSYAISGRRTELGVVALRGSHRLPRWWLGVGEGVCAVLLAAPVGVLLGAGVAWLIGEIQLPAGFGGVGLGGTAGTIEIAIAGSLVAVVASAWRPVRSATVDLLRDVPERGSAWRSVAFDFVIVALAATAMFQLVSQNGTLAGVQLVAPALTIGAVGLIVARLVGPIAALVGRWGLRGNKHGAGPRRLGISLGALQLARRPGAARLFALFTVAIGLVTFAGADLDVASVSTDERARVQLGASVVYDTVTMTRLQLRDAVRKADPDGRWAMAVSGIPQVSSAEPPILAVDATRLATVAQWPAGGISAADAAHLLNPDTNHGVEFSAYKIALDLSIPDALRPSQEDDGSGTTVESQAGVRVSVEPTSGGGAQDVFGKLAVGRQTISLDTPWCGDGCRLTGIGVFQYRTGLPKQVQVTLHSIAAVLPTPGPITSFDGPFRQPDPDSGAQFAGDFPETIAASPDGLNVTGQPNGPQFYVEVIPVDAPYPVPALSAVPLKHREQGMIENQQIPMVRVGGLPGMPRIASSGILVDLTAVDRAWSDVSDHSALFPQVWLGPHAPPDALDRLLAAGIQIQAKHTLADERDYLKAQGPAAARHFFAFGLVAVLAIALAGAVVTAAVDRDRRGGELRALRVQGLPRSSVRRAAFIGQVSLAIVAAVIGPATGLAVWKLSSTKIPLFVDNDNTFVALRSWPEVGPTAVFAGGAVVVLVGMMFLTAWDLRRVVRRGDIGSAR